MTVGFGGDPSVIDSMFAGIPFGQLLKITPAGGWRSVADIAAYEGVNNPDGLQLALYVANFSIVPEVGEVLKILP